jgi:hypothetical protein
MPASKQRILKARKGWPSMWTADRVATLEAMWKAGAPCAEIARAVGLSKGAITGKADRLELPMHPGVQKARQGLHRAQ